MILNIGLDPFNKSNKWIARIIVYYHEHDRLNNIDSRNAVIKY